MRLHGRHVQSGKWVIVYSNPLALVLRPATAWQCQTRDDAPAVMAVLTARPHRSLTEQQRRLVPDLSPSCRRAYRSWRHAAEARLQPLDGGRDASPDGQRREVMHMSMRGSSERSNAHDDCANACSGAGA